MRGVSGRRQVFQPVLERSLDSIRVAAVPQGVLMTDLKDAGNVEEDGSGGVVAFVCVDSFEESSSTIKGVSRDLHA